MTRQGAVGRRGQDLPPPHLSRLLPGLALAGLAVLVASAVSSRATLSALVVAVALGVLAANLGLLPAACRPGLAFAAQRLLRVGVVLLGFRLALGDVARVGAPGIAVVVTVVALTFFGTVWLGRRMGLSAELSLLTAIGFAICGASAIAAMRGVLAADDDEVAFGIALVTLCGTLAMVVLPLVGGPLGLRGEAFGQWVGASVHDVAQVVATAAADGTVALRAAVVVKLTRVVLLAPLVAGVSVAMRRAGSTPGGVRPPLVPLFVVGFLAAVAVRTTGLIPVPVLAAIGSAEQILLSAALFGLGAGVHLRRLRVVGGRALALGLISWALVAGTAYAGVVLVR